MSDAVGRTAHAFDASREEQGLCPHEKNPAFDAGMVFSKAEERSFFRRKGASSLINGKKFQIVIAKIW